MFRGALANGLKLAAICAPMTPIYDWCKENSYFFLGPSWLNRFWATAVAVIVGSLVSMPFDMIRTRLYTMRPLPNGVMPYSGTFDCLSKILRFECNSFKSSTVQSLYAGFEMYWARLFLICWVSQYILDIYHTRNYVPEIWNSARFSWQGQIDYDIHDPYTDKYLKAMVANVVGPGGLPGARPLDGSDFIVV